MKPVIICGGSMGRAVIFGYVEEIPKAEEVVNIHRARMILMWGEESCGIFGLAKNGPKGDKDSVRITTEVEVVSDTARQVLKVSPTAEKAINDWPAFE